MYTGPNIITDGLVLYLDAANQKSYTGSVTTWYDLSGNGNNGTLTNGATFSSDNRGSIVFDGVDDQLQSSDEIHIFVITVLLSKCYTKIRKIGQLTKYYDFVFKFSRYVKI